MPFDDQLRAAVKAQRRLSAYPRSRAAKAMGRIAERSDLARAGAGTGRQFCRTII